MKRFDQKMKDFIFDENDIPGAKLPNLLKSVLVRFYGDGFFVEERKRLVNSLVYE